MNDHDKLRNARYLSLRTFRKSGTGVDTPIWFAELQDQIYCGFSAGDAGKVKRLRNNNRVQLAACDIKGGLLGGWIAGQCDVVSDLDFINQALAALRAKYGWQMYLLDAGSKLTGKYDRRAYLRLIVNPESTAPQQHRTN